MCVDPGPAESESEDYLVLIRAWDKLRFDVVVRLGPGVLGVVACHVRGEMTREEKGRANCSKWLGFCPEARKLMDFVDQGRPSNTSNIKAEK